MAFNHVARWYILHLCQMLHQTYGFPEGQVCTVPEQASVRAPVLGLGNVLWCSCSCRHALGCWKDLLCLRQDIVFKTSLLGGIEKLHVACLTLAWLGQLQDHPVVMSSMHGVLHTTHYTSRTHTLLPLHTMYFPLCNVVMI